MEYKIEYNKTFKTIEADNFHIDHYGTLTLRKDLKDVAVFKLWECVSES